MFSVVHLLSDPDKEKCRSFRSHQDWGTVISTEELSTVAESAWRALPEQRREELEEEAVRAAQRTEEAELRDWLEANPPQCVA